MSYGLSGRWSPSTVASRLRHRIEDRSHRRATDYRRGVDFTPLRFLLLTVAGWLHREQRATIDDLRAENA